MGSPGWREGWGSSRPTCSLHGCPRARPTDRQPLQPVNSYHLESFSFLCPKCTFQEGPLLPFDMRPDSLGVIEPFNFIFFSITGWGIDLDYHDSEWFALETYTDHSVVFEISSDPQRPHGLWHTRLPYPSSSPGACSKSTIQYHSNPSLCPNQ